MKKINKCNCFQQLNNFSYKSLSHVSASLSSLVLIDSHLSRSNQNRGFETKIRKKCTTDARCAIERKRACFDRGAPLIAVTMSLIIPIEA